MRTLQAQVSPRLLAEVPRFFGSFESALGELFQNAYRSGATQVSVAYDRETHSLTLADNGPGLADPQALLTAGETGWDEARVIEPAGVGAFAILRDEYVRMVQYESHGAGNWRMTLSPKVLRGELVPVTDLAPDGGEAGLTVRLFLHDAIQIGEELIQRARAFYSFEVRFSDGDDEWHILEPLRPWVPDLRVETSVGTLEWSSSRNFANGAHALDEVVWEYRAFPSLALGKALSAAAQVHPYRELAETAVQLGCVRWFVHPECGVRPKLPDRSELLADDALTAAAEKLVAALIEQIIAVSRQAARDWPERVQAPWQLSPASAPWLKFPTFSDQLLPLLGWWLIRYTNLSEFNVYATLDGVEVEESERKFFDRNARPVSSYTLALTLNTLGHPTSLDPNADTARVTISGERRSVGSSQHIALAERIEVEGIGTLPYLLTDADHFDLPDLKQVVGGIVFAGSAAECIRFIDESDELIHLVALREEYYGSNLFEWLEWKSGEPELNYEQVRADLTREVTRAFQPDLTQAREAYYQVRDAQPTVRKAIEAVSWVAAYLERIDDSVLNDHLTCLHECETTLQTLVQAAEHRTDELTHAARL